MAKPAKRVLGCAGTWVKHDFSFLCPFPGHELGAGLGTSPKSPPPQQPVRAPGQQCPTLAPTSHLSAPGSLSLVPLPTTHHLVSQRRQDDCLLNRVHHQLPELLQHPLQHRLLADLGRASGCSEGMELKVPAQHPQCHPLRGHPDPGGPPDSWGGPGALGGGVSLLPPHSLAVEVDDGLQDIVSSW